MTTKRKKTKARRDPNGLRAKADATMQAIRENDGKLPKPRVEVGPIRGGGFAYREIDKYGRRGEWSETFTLRNNTRRAARRAYPDLPVVSLD